jgi:hypothetical protein
LKKAADANLKVAELRNSVAEVVKATSIHYCLDGLLAVFAIQRER